MNNDLENIDSLSEEILLLIFSLLEKTSLGRLASVSKHFQCLSEDNQLWKSFLLEEGLINFSQKNPPDKFYKNLVKTKILYFNVCKNIYIEKYPEAQLTCPPPPDIQKPLPGYFDFIFKSETFWEKLVNLIDTANERDLEKFLRDNHANKSLLENNVISDVNKVLALAVNKNENIFKTLITFFTTNAAINKLLLENQKSRWVLKKCLELDIELSFANCHPIFYALASGNDSLINFLIAFDPQCLTKKSSKERTPPEYAFFKSLNHDINDATTLGSFFDVINRALFLLEASYFLDKNLLTNEITARFLDFSHHLSDEEFKKLIGFLNIKTFQTDKHISVLDYYLDTPPSIQIMNQSKFVILVTAYPDIINNTDKEQNTVLHKAANAKRLIICRLLLENKADPNLSNAAGDTCLHYLANCDWSDKDVDKLNEFLPLLINKYGASLTRKNKQKQTAIDIASAKHNTLFLKILIENKFIFVKDIKASHQAPDLENQTLINGKKTLLWTLCHPKEKDKSIENDPKEPELNTASPLKGFSSN